MLQLDRFGPSCDVEVAHEGLVRLAVIAHWLRLTGLRIMDNFFAHQKLGLRPILRGVKLTIVTGWSFFLMPST